MTKEIRLNDEAGKQIGIMSFQAAKAIAEEQELDLVLVTKEATLAVYKLGNLDKLRFEQQKKEKEKRVKSKQQIVETKEVRFTPVIDDHDYHTKMNQVLQFLQKGKKVKISIRFKGRMITHQNIGKAIMERLIVDTADVAEVETKPKMDGRQLLMMLRSKK